MYSSESRQVLDILETFAATAPVAARAIVLIVRTWRGYTVSGFQRSRGHHRFLAVDFVHSSVGTTRPP
jgi:hypothetical protein